MIICNRSSTLKSEWSFVRIGGDRDDDFIEHPQSALDQIHVAIGDRIEGAGVDSNLNEWHRKCPQAAGSGCCCGFKKCQESITISPLIIQDERAVPRFDLFAPAVLRHGCAYRVEQMVLRDQLERGTDQTSVVRRIDKNQIESLTPLRQRSQRRATGKTQTCERAPKPSRRRFSRIAAADRAEASTKTAFSAPRLRRLQC